MLARQLRQPGRTLLALLSVAIIIGAAIGDRFTGLSVTYFHDLNWASSVSRGTDRAVGSDSILQDAPFTPNVGFSAVWSGYLFVPRTGDYTFSLTAYGDVSLLLGVQPGGGDATRAIAPPGGTVTLERGTHAIVIALRHPEGLYGLDVLMAPPGGALERLSSTALSRRPYQPLAYRAIVWLDLARTAVLTLWAAAGLLWIAKRVRWVVLVPLVAATIAFVLGVAYDRPAWLRGPAPFPPEWQWLRTGTIVLLGLAPLLAIAAVVVAWLAAVVSSTTFDVRRRAAAAIVCAPLAVFAFQLAALHLQGGGAAATIVRRTAGPWYDTFFRDAVGMKPDAATFVARYPTLLETLSLHGSVHPPGPALYYRSIVWTMERHPGLAAGVIGAFERIGVEPERLAEPGNASATPIVAAALVGGLSIIACGALAAWPIAAMVAFATRSRRAAASAALLWTFCPAMAFFASEFNQVLTFLVVAAGALALGALEARSRPAVTACGIATGIAAGLALFFSFGAVPMLGTVGLLVGVMAIRTRRPVARIGLVLALAVVGVAAVFALPTAIGYNHLAVAREVLSYHLLRFNPRRSARVWLRFNLLDFSIFAGWPILAWGAVALIRSRGRSPLLWAVLAAVLALDLSDVTRGEVGRLWMPLTAPLLVAVVASANEQRDAGQESTLVAVLLAAATLALEIFWLSYS